MRKTLLDARKLEGARKVEGVVNLTVRQRFHYNKDFTQLSNTKNTSRNVAYDKILFYMNLNTNNTLTVFF